MIASLDMYDLPEIRAATDEWWAALARAFRTEGINGVPAERARFAEESDAWSRPDLFFAQICGYPLRKCHRETLTVIGTPCYAADGCAGPRYSSVVIVQRGAGIGALAALRGQRLACNGATSQSGMSALRALLAEEGHGPDFFGDTIRSGGHRTSVALVTSGEADTAAIDCVTWALLLKHAPEECAAVEVLTRTPDAPGLPYVVPAATDAGTLAALRRGLTRAVADPAGAEARRTLLIEDIALLTDHDYVEIDEIETRAAARGLHSLF
ncbi:phosphate/phosphite/phosphonate ABC transporter substrate-binding protein [Nisaea sp.]|uniref:phosphate/phosphite/phosphonate ABC transporter substrate-binding protein n=1 Tax=Nisaea sp. TaxID=2024842 RepID=UPI003B52AF45